MTQRGPVLVGRARVDAAPYSRALDFLFRLRKTWIGAGDTIRPAEGGAERHLNTFVQQPFSDYSESCKAGGAGKAGLDCAC